MSREVIDGLSYNEKKVILTLRKYGTLTPETLVEKGNFNQLIEVMNATSWLQAKGLVKIDAHAKTQYILVRKQDAVRDLPERRALKILDKHHGIISIDTLRKSKKLAGHEVPIAVGWLKRKGWATVTKRDGDTILQITNAGKHALTTRGKDELLLKALADSEFIDEADTDKHALQILKQRSGLVREILTTTREIYLTAAGEQVADTGLELKAEVSQLTPELIQTGKWRTVALRRYDIDTYAPIMYGGKPHPLRQLIFEIRRVLLDMGFTEIKGQYVESCFWNMDALFIPQDHPARDLQDTFYLDKPERIKLEDRSLVEKIKLIHETGGDTLSEGWKYLWEEREAERAILRTHTTVNTIRYLSEHPDPPVKVFSVERVFRKEAIDATHLPEFYQVEGILMEENANFRMLIGILKEFYRRLGFEHVQVRPAYFPYTEPSMEVLVLFQNKWLELGGSGIFRPEVVEPFGVKHPVLAWGLGLERLAMLRLGLDDIRKLYISDIDWLKTCPLI